MQPQTAHVLRLEHALESTAGACAASERRCAELEASAAKNEEQLLTCAHLLKALHERLEQQAADNAQATAALEARLAVLEERELERRAASARLEAASRALHPAGDGFLRASSPLRTRAHVVVERSLPAPESADRSGLFSAASNDADARRLRLRGLYEVLGS